MVSPAKPGKRLDRREPNVTIDRHHRRVDFGQEAIDDSKCVSERGVGDARQAGGRFEDGDSRGVVPARGGQTSGKTGRVLLHGDDADDRRCVEEHQVWPDKSSKNALSAGFPPDRRIAWKSAWI